MSLKFYICLSFLLPLMAWGEEHSGKTGFPYPTKHDPPKIPTNFSGSGAAPVTPAHPTDFATKDLGFSLKAKTKSTVHYTSYTWKLKDGRKFKAANFMRTPDEKIILFNHKKSYLVLPLSDLSHRDQTMLKGLVKPKKKLPPNLFEEKIS